MESKILGLSEGLQAAGGSPEQSPLGSGWIPAPRWELQILCFELAAFWSYCQCLWISEGIESFVAHRDSHVEHSWFLLLRRLPPLWGWSTLPLIATGLWDTVEDPGMAIRWRGEKPSFQHVLQHPGRINRLVLPSGGRNQGVQQAGATWAHIGACQQFKTDDVFLWRCNSAGAHRVCFWLLLGQIAQAGNGCSRFGPQTFGGFENIWSLGCLWRFARPAF